MLIFQLLYSAAHLDFHAALVKKVPWIIPLLRPSTCWPFLHFAHLWLYFQLLLAQHPTHTNNFNLPHTSVLQPHDRNPVVLLEKRIL